MPWIPGYISSPSFDPSVISSGSVSSGDLGIAVVFSGNIASGQIGSPHIASGGVLSGNIGSGQIGGRHYASGSVKGLLGGDFTVASGTFGPNDLASGVILSGHVASGQLGQFHYSSGSVKGLLGGGFSIASGTFGSTDLGSGVILSGHVSSGQIGGSAVASGSITSGMLASGVISLMSIIDVFTANEAISGFRAVAVTSGGRMMLANAASGLRLPAIGVVAGNVAATADGVVTRFGRLTTTSGLDVLWSGMAGKPLYAGSGGAICTLSGLLSGMGYNRLGIAVSGGILVMPSMEVTSGGITNSILGSDLF